MSKAKEEINCLLERIYKKMNLSCREELKEIGRIMSERRKSLDYSVWQVGMEVDAAFDDVEKVEQAVSLGGEKFDYMQFRRFLLCFFALDELYTVYENNPNLLEFEKLCKLIYKKYDQERGTKGKS